MSEFDDTVARLKKLTNGKLTPKQRSDVIDALDSKYAGIQSLAVQVLSEVGDQEAVDAISKIFDRFSRKPLSLRGVALRALILNVSRVDPGWAMDHVLLAKEREGLDVNYWSLVRLLPKAVVEKKLRQARGSDIASRRAAAAEIAAVLGYT